jgi:hypothetical protein
LDTVEIETPDVAAMLVRLAGRAMDMSPPSGQSKYFEKLVIQNAIKTGVEAAIDVF